MVPVKYVQVSVNVPHLTGVFDYHLPPELEGQAQPGCLVVVPFGQRRAQGVIVRTVDEPQVQVTRAVLELIDTQPVVTGTQLRLAHWLAESNLATVGACLSCMLPPGLAQRADTLYSLVREPEGREAPPPGGTGEKILDLLRRRGPLRGQQMDRALNTASRWRAAVLPLVRRGLVHREGILPPPAVRPKFVRTAQLVCTPETAAETLPRLGRPGTAVLERRQAALRFLMNEPWPVDLPWVYAQTGCTLADLTWLAEAGLIQLGESEVWRDPLHEVDVLADELPELTPEQSAACQALSAGLSAAAARQNVRPYLLHGVTGSGKTEVYLRAVAETLRLGRQAIVLVPEIALTPQTLRRFLSRFPGRVGLLHSQLSDGERYDTWRRARAGLLSVVIGPRSALFAPLPNPGLIILDEAHDDSYYQSENPPAYSTTQAALALARLSGAVCLFGSATPDISGYYRAEQENWQILRLPERVLAHRAQVEQQASSLGLTVSADNHGLPLPPVQIVDMRQELKAGNRSIFSRVLREALERTLRAGQQSILFLNRRGTATFVFCRECGASLRCPRCDIPLTFHAGQSALLCHYCGYRRTNPTVCPECKSDSIRHYGTGTEKVESEVRALFPKARVLRWDSETTREKGAHELILGHFANGRADILVGTQMLAKGLDLPRVTLVGAVLADVGVNMPDYRAGERAFQVLTQVAGRAGRSLLGGEVIFQTFQPEHYAIQAAACHDFAGFYRQELDYRRQLGYPPFYRLTRLEYRHRDPEQAEAAAQALAGKLRGWIAAGDRRATELIGPVPCFFGQINNIHRWQIVLRGPDPAGLLRGRALNDWRIEIDPPNLL